MPDAIRKCELEMTLAVLRAIKSGAALHYELDDEYEWNFYLTVKNEEHHPLYISASVGREIIDNQPIRKHMRPFKRGPWLPGAIEKVERELEGLK